MILEKPILNKLKKQMDGLQSTVAREMKPPVHRSTVSRVLEGEIDNDAIIKKCIEVRDRERKKNQKLSKAIMN